MSIKWSEKDVINAMARALAPQGMGNGSNALLEQFKARANQVRQIPSNLFGKRKEQVG